MLSRTHHTHRCSNCRIADISTLRPRIAGKNGPPKQSDFIEILEPAVKMKTKSGLGKDRGTKSHFTDPCKNHVKAHQKASRSFFTILDSFHQIIVKIKRICNKSTHFRNALWSEILSKPFEIQWCVASVFSQTPFQSHLVTSLAPKRNMQRCPPPNVPPCRAMCLPASKWFCLPQNWTVQTPA